MAPTLPATERRVPLKASQADGGSALLSAMQPRFLLLLPFAAIMTHAGTLYDGSLGTSPSAQGLSYQSLFGTAVETVGGSFVTLDTTSSSTISAGYYGTAGSPGSIPVLDRTAGFTVSFTVRMVSESHGNNDRAGFNVIALGSDKQGIELDFWTNEIWEQTASPAFTHGAGMAFDTTASLLQYDLNITGSTYTLKNGATTLLTGAVKDYSALNPVYDQASFLFFGDNTTSAQSQFEMSHIAVVVPEPATGGLLAIGLTAGWAARRRKLPRTDSENRY
jgi:hypothetical protein